ncbi:hypothetical protein HRR81_003925 [Exophiala dermatitidis]|nr:hypothetical protein HRR73_006715 [Exophiala dermatitidis]KAJ4536100.1 hypothetical protein HRR77_007547 [Exophiala dermatitidis]KAJ4571113.1 hypothetical protein HRR79_004028 [Exophiala dermatitidis]KAJ4576037.1 hypothetical protein HRR81_003925 [Exophiala dermatitidis]
MPDANQIKIELDAAREICEDHSAGQTTPQTKRCCAKRTWVTESESLQAILLTFCPGQSSQQRAEKMTFESLPHPPPSAVQSATPSPQAGPTPTVSPLPFKINRTPSSNLPIYESSKAGGSKHITSIRKISGDLNELASRIRSALGLQQHIVDVKGRRKETVAINWTTRQVVVRGWRGPEIKKWAEFNGF